MTTRSVTVRWLLAWAAVFSLLALALPVGLFWLIGEVWSK